MKRFLTLFVAVALVFVSTLSAQSAEEVTFRKSQAKKLNAFAKKALKKGFPRKAKLVYLMVVSEYDSDNNDAHKALGHQKSGKEWVPIEGFRFPREDKPDPSAAKLLLKNWKTLSTDLVRGHKRMAAKYEKAGRSDVAQAHYRQILRFVPGDEDAKKFLGLVQVDDALSGTDMEQMLYERGVMLEDIVKQEVAKDYPVEELPDTNRNPILDKAQVTYISVKSEHFILRGDFSKELLIDAAVWSERAYQVIAKAYEGNERMFVKDTSKWGVTEYSFFKLPDTFKQIVTAHRGRFSPEDFKFTLEHTAGTRIGNLSVSTRSGAKGVKDSAIRAVAHSFSALGLDALTEGIGHTFVGIMLRNNATFLVDLKEQLGTSTEEEEIDQFSPDIDMWDNLAVEAAWKKTTTPAAELPLIHASKFNDDMRIKSWSFCHYLVLRDPLLLRHLSMTGGERNPIDVEKKFTKATKGLSLAQLDKEWKDFFTGATPVMRAIRKRSDPMTAVSPGVKKWLDAINEVRTKTYHAAKLNWSADFSSRCRDHAKYLAENKLTGPDEEQRQDKDKPLSTHPGNMFAQMAMVATGAKDPKKVIANWMQFPGYRDVFMVNTLKTIGLYADKGTVVLNVVQGLINPRGRGFRVYPKSGMTRIPKSVKVADLGPELKAFLEREGHGQLEVLGYPLSFHCGNSGLMPRNRDSIKCSVRVNNREDVAGLLHFADDGSHRRSSSPGLVVFYPLKPMRKGSEVEVTWTFEYGDRLDSIEATYHH